MLSAVPPAAMKKHHHSKTMKTWVDLGLSHYWVPKNQGEKKQNNRNSCLYTEDQQEKNKKALTHTHM